MTIRQQVTAAAAIFLASAAFQATALTLDGHTIPDTLQAGPSQLVLNGAGIRKKVVFDVYLAALYTSRKTNQASELINSTQPRLLRLTLLRDIDSASLAEALNDGLKDNTNDAQWQAIRPAAEKFASLLLQHKDLKKGSVIDILFTGAGVAVSALGKQQSAIADVDFSRALLAVWLGSDPAQSSLKRALLGSD